MNFSLDIVRTRINKQRMNQMIPINCCCQLFCFIFKYLKCTNDKHDGFLLLNERRVGAKRDEGVIKLLVRSADYIFSPDLQTDS